ncbi:hypothetical protein CBQ26_00530 [Deinococcus indicus]|uniref:Uncharacterized protein n=1 Tax=Deinococcus indicus TaxID=223556 RepID=A0A246BTH0_9DEIO|nr:hypothetical protein [Deinococcus indicus]OWL98978.1 hypothetical protein CBQ26_00530 [Deinococcus indicus]
MPQSSVITIDGLTINNPSLPFAERDALIVPGVVSLYDVRNAACWTPGAPSASKNTLNNLVRASQTAAPTATIITPTTMTETTTPVRGLVLPGQTVANPVGYIDQGQPAALTGPNLKIIWLTVVSLPTNSGAAIWARAGSSNTGSNSQFLLAVANKTTQVFSWKLWNSADTAITEVVDPTAFVLGMPVQLAMSTAVSGADTVVTLYRNGVSIKTQTITGTTALFNSTRNNAIGAFTGGANGTGFATNLRYYRSLQEDLILSGRTPATVVASDWANNRAAFGL